MSSFAAAYTLAEAPRVTHLWVQSQCDEHEEEEHSPHRGHWHPRHGIWVHDERQPRPWNQKCNTYISFNRKLSVNVNGSEVLAMFPIPLAATSSTVVFSSLAMKPRNEKITNPAKIEVEQFPIVTISVSLYQMQKRQLVLFWFCLIGLKAKETLCRFFSQINADNSKNTGWQDNQSVSNLFLCDSRIAPLCREKFFWENEET